MEYYTIEQYRGGGRSGGGGYGRSGAVILFLLLRDELRLPINLPFFGSDIGLLWNKILSFFSTGNPVYIATSGSPRNGSYNQGDAEYPVYPYFGLYRDTGGWLIYYNSSPAMSYSETPGYGWHTYYLFITGTYAGEAYVSNRSIFIIETKR
jgi:hypothetical protein